MPVTEERRNQYSKRYHFRLETEEAKKLDQKLKDEKLTLPQFVRSAIAKTTEEVTTCQ